MPSSTESDPEYIGLGGIYVNETDNYDHIGLDGVYVNESVAASTASNVAIVFHPFMI
jgi:hypothetical protein